MRKPVRWAILVVIAAIASIIFWPGGPTAVGQQAACELAQPPLQPEHPLEMNTVTMGPLFKTVAMEKEVFVCFNTAGQPTRIVDLETFIEIVERAITTKPGTKTVEKRVDIARCVKDFETGRITCDTRPRKLARTEVPLEGCQPEFEQRGIPTDPVVMNTERVGRIAKTIKVEKEVLRCENGIGDLYLFTEIVELARRVRGVGPTVRPVETKFEGILCLKDTASAQIRECSEFIPRRR